MIDSCVYYYESGDNVGKCRLANHMDFCNQARSDFKCNHFFFVNKKYTTARCVHCGDQYPVEVK